MDHQTAMPWKGIENSYGLEVAPHTTANFPEVVSDQPGLHYVPPQDPRNYGVPPYSQTEGTEYKAAADQQYITNAPTASKDEIRRKRRVRFWILVAVIFIVILAIGLGAGLGVHFSRGNSDSGSTPLPSSTQTSSPESGTCMQGTTYCGWYLINNASYASAYLYSLDASDPWDDLFLCSQDNTVMKSQYCGGPGTCYGPYLNKNDCSTTTGQSCCYTTS